MVLSRGFFKVPVLQSALEGTGFLRLLPHRVHVVSRRDHREQQYQHAGQYNRATHGPETPVLPPPYPIRGHHQQ